MFERLKQFLKKLDRINQEEFKAVAPDCCTINRLSPDQKQRNMPQKSRNTDSGSSIIKKMLLGTITLHPEKNA